MGQQPWHDYNGESSEQLLALTATHRLDSLAVAFETAIQQKAATLVAVLLNGIVLSSAALEAEMTRDDEERDGRLEVCNDAYYGAGEDIATALIGDLQEHRDEIHLR